MTKFFMMVGLPASGKSTYAEILAIRENAEIFSSDAYRAKFGTGEEDQTINGKIFGILHNDIKQALKAGKNCIYDATNLISKRRRAFLQEINNIPCEKICVLVVRPFEDCVESNWARERNVPDHAMMRMYKSFETPYMEEGWDDIALKLDEEYCTLNMDFFIQFTMNFDQHNSHHTSTLGQHCINVANNVSDVVLSTSEHCDYSTALLTAAYLHDYGKMYCKQFKNSKGEPTEEAHYYNHQNIGAYDAFFFKNVKDKLLVSWLICNHMAPYFWKTPENADKYRKLWGDQKFKMIEILHKADEAGH